MRTWPKKLQNDLKSLKMAINRSKVLPNGLKSFRNDDKLVKSAPKWHKRLKNRSKMAKIDAQKCRELLKCVLIRVYSVNNVFFLDDGWTENSSFFAFDFLISNQRKKISSKNKDNFFQKIDPSSNNNYS